jgi:uncharacterized Ntn-hydrolase superfamily protein
MTFSIVGRDPNTGDLGIAVQSKFLAVGAVVPWARAGVGAIATQSYANTAYGPDGLGHLASGKSAQEAVDLLLAADQQPEQRQVGIVDASGHSATFTGPGCYQWAGGICDPNFAAQGNILVGAETVAAMAQTFQASRGHLWHRLVEALAAGQRAGGDSRGQESAALLVVREKGGYAGFNDRMIDLRVDDHPAPIEELARLLSLYELYFLKPEPEDYLPLDATNTSELQRLLTRSGDYTGPISGTLDDDTFNALERYGGRENLEERLLHDKTDLRIDQVVLSFMQDRLGE